MSKQTRTVEEGEKKKVLFCLCTVCVGCAGWSQNKHNCTHGQQSGRGSSICRGRLLFVFLNFFWVSLPQDKSPPAKTKTLDRMESQNASCDPIGVCNVYPRPVSIGCLTWWTNTCVYSSPYQGHLLAKQLAQLFIANHINQLVCFWHLNLISYFTEGHNLKKSSNLNFDAYK